uniref:Nucleotide exchange factor SIL1 n=1 Tax=Amblyomma triste TaxID=251400 RepID=A0A023GGW1_AMBTT
MLQKRLLCFAAALLVFIENTCQQQGLSVVAGHDQSQKKDEEKSNEPEESQRKVFQPTNEWKQVQPGEAIPAGLHLRMNLKTGQTEAKLMDESESKGTQQYESSGTHSNRLLLEQAKGGPSIKLSEKKNLPWNMNELKKKMSSLKLEAKSESEILYDLLENYRNASEVDKEALLRDMEFLVHQYDRAVDFLNMGGLLAIAPDLNSTSDTVRELVAYTLGSAAQGNPKVQKTVLGHGLLPHLLRLVALDPSGRVRLRCLFALSCLVRQLPEAQESLLHHGGLTVLAGLFTSSSGSAKLQLKAVTLLHDLVVEQRLRHEAGHPTDSELTQSIQLHGFCTLVPKLLHSPDVDVQEKVVQAMTALANTCLPEFQQHVPLLRTLLSNYRRRADDEYMSEKADQAADYFEGLLHSVTQLLDSLQQKHKDEL